VNSLRWQQEMLSQKINKDLASTVEIIVASQVIYISYVLRAARLHLKALS
jgi:hypothetical protein